MLNKYPLWKYALIVLVLVVGFIYSAPNLYPDDPAVQISGASSALQVNQADLDRVSKALVDAKIAVKGASLGEKGSGLIRLTNQEDQLPAKDVVRKALGDDYVVALNLAQTTPQWLRNLGASPMKLGLDLSGGVHFLLEVDMDKAMTARMKVYEGEVKTLLRKERVRYRSLPQQDGGIMLGFADDATREQARALIRKNFNDFDLTTTDRNELAVLRLALTQAKVAEIREYSIKQNLTTVRNRVNELGVAEPLVQRQGANRIVVELPGVQDTAEAKRILGKTANLEFRFGAEPGASKATTEVFEFREGGRSAAVERGLIITGDQVTDAQASFDEHGRPQVNIRLDGHGGELMSRATRSNVGRSMAVIFIEQKPVTRYVKQTVGGVEKDVAVQSFVEEKKIISLATIQSPLGSQFRITGLNGQGESSELALLLRAGGLAAPMYFAEERTIGPSLGADNITKGIDASLWGMLFVSLFIIAIYRAFGVLATIALAGNMVLLLALMSLLGATLTLPGIAGIVLTMGMAVDANVLIFSRIREEIAAGMSVQRAIHEGFNRAYSAIVDANLTTLLVGGILFAMGTGPVKGFAVTMSLGIFTSMFTAVMVTRALVNLTCGGRDIKKLWV
ncbi:protein translocase subunit SecD [Pseudomonas alloputida]|jgi:preprotein translocase subunit SecD|uniref:Protein translocase subunit SecD n=2 Tax=Pseudomonas putida group TaxID=136845 RepID=A0A7D5VWV1_PSEPU|nr:MULTISPECIES: protein translocase subunit SecD [Pseudomonas]WPE25253.1 Protein translocase subunit SecD [Pseudomonas hunanensis]ANI36275.1 preprotein translocase subunit SecD [Pseudomonas sp. JY-Q]EKT4506135.1 protein translocase subunit SecD [Pseudomonas putida]MDQ7966038.1 protein translocase subunit SecD [Pseudomonas plecoglossicida]QLJ13585.1 protein translocase subunit SecD [Pseudomonas putida]